MDAEAGMRGGGPLPGTQVSSQGVGRGVGGDGEVGGREKEGQVGAGLQEEEVKTQAESAHPWLVKTKCLAFV